MLSGLANVNAQNTVPLKDKIFINVKGGIHNHEGTELGYIDKDNIVRNTKGQKIYFFDKSRNVVDANSKKLSKTQKTGNFYSVDGTSILTTKD